jgi:hypothetical protein
MRISLVCFLCWIWLMIALDRDGQISRFSYGEFAIVEATDSQSMSSLLSRVRVAADNRSEAKHGKSTSYPASTLSCDCRSHSHPARSSRTTEFQSTTLDIFYRYYRLGPSKCYHEGICRIVFRVEQSSLAPGQSSDGCRCSFHNYH